MTHGTDELKASQIYEHKDTTQSPLHLYLSSNGQFSGFIKMNTTPNTAADDDFTQALDIMVEPLDDIVDQVDKLTIDD